METETTPENVPPAPVGSGDLFCVLRDATKRISEWDVTQYSAYHKPSGISLWIANGWMFLNHDNDSGHALSLSVITRFRLWPHMRRLLDAKAIAALSSQNVEAHRLPPTKPFDAPKP